MFRLMSVATLVMILLCFFVGAGIALADEGVAHRTGDIPVDMPSQINDATVPTTDTVVENLAEADVYDFSDYIKERAQQPRPQSKPVDADEIEEPGLRAADAMDC